ncbi:MAG: hypothetical protein ACFFD2_00455 [Promethearchaeota archaeon]
MIETKIKEVKFLVCPKCKHEWVPQNENKLPKVCPRCKYYLDRALDKTDKQKEGDQLE